MEPDDGIDWNASIGPWKLADAVKITAELNSSDIRGSILLAGAMLDRALTKAVCLKFASITPSPGSAWEGFVRQGPVERRTDLALLLGIIDDGMQGAIETVFKIRNRFAHQEFPVAINSGELQSILDGSSELKDAAKQPLGISPNGRPQEVLDYLGACTTLWRIITYRR